MKKDRWRPIYRYPFGNAFVYLIGSLVGTGTGAAAGLITVQACQAAISCGVHAAAVPAAIALVIGHVIARYLFFVTQITRLRNAILASIAAFLQATGIVLAPAMPFLGIGIMVIAWGIVAVFFAHYGRIRLYTDAVVIGKLVLPYSEFVYTEFSTGKPFQDHVPEQGKGKAIEIITPIDYEYIEENFGVFHPYTFIITREKTYVVQSLTHRPEFVANVRNAWACYDWDRRQKQEQKQDGTRNHDPGSITA